MAVVYSPDSEYAKEMQRWEGHKYTGDVPPGRPYQYRDYPVRMYKAFRAADGSRQFEAFTANDDREQRNLESRGFVVGGQKAALDALSAHEQWEAKLAAEINHEARRMSERAQQDVAAAQEAAGARHLPSIPETPVKRRGRRPKAQPVTA